jgi:hypothetical protein
MLLRCLAAPGISVRQFPVSGPYRQDFHRIHYCVQLQAIAPHGIEFNLCFIRVGSLEHFAKSAQGRAYDKVT